MSAQLGVSVFMTIRNKAVSTTTWWQVPWSCTCERITLGLGLLRSGGANRTLTKSYDPNPTKVTVGIVKIVETYVEVIK